MAFRSDLRDFQIPVTLFKEFDHRKVIKTPMPNGFDLKPGDQMFWECAQFSGVLEVVSSDETDCVIKKI
jgi:hypothetical protein